MYITKGSRALNDYLCLMSAKNRHKDFPDNTAVEIQQIIEKCMKHVLETNVVNAAMKHKINIHRLDVLSGYLFEENIAQPDTSKSVLRDVSNMYIGCRYDGDMALLLSYDDICALLPLAREYTVWMLNACDADDVFNSYCHVMGIADVKERVLIFGNGNMAAGVIDLLGI